jgi:hypothetical protein
MGRMSEWFMEWHEDDDLDLMLCELAHEEELHQRQLKEQQTCQSHHGLITPLSFRLPNSPPMNSSTPGQVTVMTPTGSWQPKKS